MTLRENINKRNVLYFEASSMKELFNSLNDWQEQEKKRFLSLSIQKDHEVFSCIALTNPTEMIIVDGSAYEGAKVDRYTNALRVKEG